MKNCIGIRHRLSGVAIALNKRIHGSSVILAGVYEIKNLKSNIYSFIMESLVCHHIPINAEI